MPAASSRRKPASRKKAPRKRAKRSLLASRPALALPRVELEPHHVDILGLALIAIGIFLAGVAYLHWAGGTLGNGAVTATRFVFGSLGYAVPAALVAGGALVLLRELRPPARPLRTGILCLTAALTLALAAGTFGLGPGQTPAHEFWRASAFESRGGIIGQSELWVVTHLISTLGAHILAVFLFIAGMILVSGATLASVIRVTGAGLAGTSRALRTSTEDLVSRRPPTATRRPATAAARAATFDQPDLEPEPLLPPEPDTAELVVRATHVEAPPIGALDDSQDGTERRRGRRRRARARG